MLSETDLSGGGLGIPWGQTRVYVNQLSDNALGWNGNSWLVSNVEHLAFIGTGTISVVRNLQFSYWFDWINGAWVARYGTRVTLTHDTSNNQYLFFEEDTGILKRFNDNSSLHSPDLRGSLLAIVNAGGVEAELCYNNNDQLISFSVGDENQSSVYEYSHNASGRLASVIQIVNNEPVRRASYGYYGNSDLYGNADDLQQVDIDTWNGEEWVPIRTSYYRYYKPLDLAGFAHGLKMAIDADGWDRLVADGIDPETASDATMLAYSSYYFKYDGSRRVTQEITDGGAMTFDFAYTASGFADGYNAWKTKTVVTQPDGTQEIVYTNFIFQVILKILQSSSGQNADQWYEYFKYDDVGNETLAATSEAVAGYDESQPGLVTLKPTVGLIHVTQWYDVTDPSQGAVAGYIEYESLRQGGEGSFANGREVKLNSREYATYMQGGNTVTNLSEETVYQSDASGGGDPAATIYSHEFYPDTLQQKSITTTPPVVPVESNGNGQTYSRTAVYDLQGNNTWNKDGLGFITANVYDLITGALVQTIQDVDTDLVPDAPEGWTTPTGGGLNLVTDYESDFLGRTTQTLMPSSTIDVDGIPTAVRKASYMVYRDDLREVWSAQGYATGTAPGYGYVTLSPVSINQEDGASRQINSIMANREECGRLSASDEFPQSAWLQWTGWSYDNQGRKLWMRQYFDILSTGEGINGVNYQQINYGYDSMMRVIRQVSPGGTITRTVYDSRGLVTETYTGTNDAGATPTDPSGDGAAGNDMKQISVLQYDDGNDKGNGLLTQQTLFASDTISRVTGYLYDWRDRRIGVAGELSTYLETDYDNRDLVTLDAQHDGSATGTLLKRTTNAYDPLGRLYQTLNYAVNSSGTPGNALVASTWYDGKGRTIKTVQPGSRAWQKMVYDGVDRLVAKYLSYAANGEDDGDTNSVANDVVVEQQEMDYDAASNLLETRSYARFHNATGNGALNGPSGAQPQSRIYYADQWTDGIGRVVAVGNYGTNGGTPVERSEVIPVSSETLLVSQTVFNASGWVSDQIDPADICKHTDYDALGRPVQIIENYTGGLPGIDTDKTEERAYTLDGLLSTLTLKNSETGDQVTRWVYGTSLEESTVASTLLLTEKIFPDNSASTNPLSGAGGAADGGDRIIYAYSRQGQVIQQTDQNGTIREFDYDLLGRQIEDRVTTLGTTVNNAVLRIETSYDLQGRVSRITSYNNATVGSGSIVNQIWKMYNDFSQLEEEYQSHTGEANVGSWLIAYYYADGSQNTIRLESMDNSERHRQTWDYGAANGMDDMLSRVSSIEFDGNTFDYSYLGASTVIEVDYETPGVELTYLKQGSEPDGDAGDPYNGLDRFGRIQDHRWITTTGE